MEQVVEVENLPFKWGEMKVSTGVEKDDVDFYESFTYDGSEYHLYDCVLTSTPDSSDFFVGKIINMYEYNDQRPNPRRVELLWFFKPFELSEYLQLEGLFDVLENELFLASGTGRGLTNENLVEAISGKCNVLCVSNDIRNPLPSYEEIKSADFLFRRTFDVTSNKIREKMDDQIAGVDVKFIFNRTSSEKKACVVQKVATAVHGTADSLKPNRPLTSDSVRQIEHNVSGFSGHRVRYYGDRTEQEDNGCHKQLVTKKSTVGEERSNKDSARRDGGLDCCNASGSRRNDCHGRRDQENEVTEPLTKQKSRLAEERWTKDSYGFDDMPPKKRKLYGSVAVSDGRAKASQKISHDGRKDIRSSRDKVTTREVYSQKPSFTERKQDLPIPKNYERNEPTATEKGLSKKPSSDCNISKNTEEKMLTNADYRRQYRAFEVTQKPSVEEVKWLRSLSWEESLRDAEGQGTLVLLQNLDPTYTSGEVENIVYAALNEQCMARMIEQTSATIPHIGEALVIFRTADAAKRVIKRLAKGCLLLSNGRTLVASSVKVNSPAKPPLRFPGHIKPKAQMRQEMKSAVATSHASQKYTIEFDLALEWCLYRDRNELALKRVFDKQIAEKANYQIRFRPKHA